MMKEANLLLFDEPTNHLDLDSKEVLEEALLDYPGTMIFVSHDRYFLNRLSTRTLEFQDGQLDEYLGNYDYYIEKKTEEEERVRLLELEQEEHTPTTTESNSSQVAKQDFIQGKEDKKKKHVSASVVLMPLKRKLKHSKSGMKCCKHNCYNLMFMKTTQKRLTFKTSSNGMRK